MDSLAPSYDHKEQRYFAGVRSDLIARLPPIATALSWRSAAARDLPAHMQSMRASAGSMWEWNCSPTLQA